MVAILNPSLELLPKFGFVAGNELNAHVLDAVSRSADVGSESADLNRAVCDWTTYYHLSHARALVMEPLWRSIRSPILEVGCGMGALTRALGEAGHTVYATDVSETRLEIVRERCRDLPNVSVGLVGQDGFDGAFETVLLVGVLEYAPSVDRGAGPTEAASALLRMARTRLGRGGRLILAIENQLGVQYLAGAREDHTAIPYFGVEDRYAESGVITFGRNQLSGMLRAAGFDTQNWFYPFPDYKFPTCIFTEGGLSSDSPLDPVGLLLRAQRLSVLRQAEQSFSLSRAWEVLRRNGLLRDLSNSFLVEAMVGQPGVEHSGGAALGWVLPSPGLRNDRARVDVLFANGDTVVQQSYGVHAQGAETVPSGERVQESLWCSSTHSDALWFGLDRGWSLSDVGSTWFPDWVVAIACRLGIHPTSLHANYELPVEYLEAVPSNLFSTGTGRRFGRMELYDRDIPVPVRLDWVVYRGLLQSLLQVRQAGCVGGAFRGQALGDILNRVGQRYLPAPGSQRSFDVRRAEWELLRTLGCFEQTSQLSALEALTM